MAPSPAGITSTNEPSAPKDPGVDENALTRMLVPASKHDEAAKIAERNKLIQKVDDLLARAFLHETDHLNGRLYITHVSALKRDLIKRKVRKLMKQGEW